MMGLLSIPNLYALLLVVFCIILSDSAIDNLRGGHVALAAASETNAPVEAPDDPPENSFYRSSSWAFWKNRLGVPYFSNHTKTLVVTSYGQTTYLHCLVGNLGDRKVSWIRSRDLRIVAIGKTRYTQDTRFTPLHEEGNDVWALKIQNTRFEDAGQYECQVSYHDDMEKKMKKPVRLVVLDSVAIIAGSTERHVKEGSRLSLACHIIRSSGSPSYVYWYHNGKVVNYSDRHGVTITTNPGPQRSSNPNPLRDFGAKIEEINEGQPSSLTSIDEGEARLEPVSKLEVSNVTLGDAGAYTCAPSNARNHSVVVHVVKGENLAMQRKTSTSFGQSVQRCQEGNVVLFIGFLILLCSVH
ncbi:uncharacterized protein LOC131879162 [Tigriopus californicus]|uniref:uncharacterized protein LOC131879162 n=1 Tax=Tigriopus californicus TaxID=6832 RepID=UPI0027D9EDBD|nr:uncharacterized protein LOC131879162 [Tigriopus californicus]XP_059081392.1 uncharacterized protein LOC131879162 [Tigriopus californicus]